MPTNIAEGGGYKSSKWANNTVCISSETCEELVVQIVGAKEPGREITDLPWLWDKQVRSVRVLKTHSLQLTSKKQSEKCYVVPEARWSSLSMCLQCMTIMRSLVQDKLKRENKWLLGYRRELTEIEYFRNFWLLKCFLKIPLLPSDIPQFLHQGYCIIIHLLV